MKNLQNFLLLLALVNGGFVYAKTISVNRINSIVQHSDDPIITFAANDLRRYWKEMTGNKLTITEGIGNNKSIYLKLDSTNRELKWDGYQLITNEKGITILGKEPRAILYGVYDFLERQGCSFFYPKPDLEIIPKINRVAFINEIVNPRLEWRGIALYGVRDDQIEISGQVIDWMAKQRYNYVIVSQDRPAGTAGLAQEIFFTGKTETELLPELQKRGFIINMGEHNTHCYLDKDKLFKQHPDWFAEIDGKRTPGQICYSNKAAMKYYSAQLIEWLHSKPWVDVIGTWPLDGGGYCTCEKCSDPETVINAINQLAKDIQQIYPDKIVEYLSYKDATFIVPKAPLNSNLNILYCPDLGVKTQLEKKTG